MINQLDIYIYMGVSENVFFLSCEKSRPNGSTLLLATDLFNMFNNSEEVQGHQQRVGLNQQK